MRFHSRLRFLPPFVILISSFSPHIRLADRSICRTVFLPRHQTADNAAQGWVAEWSNAHAWKACVPKRYRGFESPPIRHVPGRLGFVAGRPGTWRIWARIRTCSSTAPRGSALPNRRRRIPQGGRAWPQSPAVWMRDAIAKPAPKQESAFTRQILNSRPDPDLTPPC